MRAFRERLERYFEFQTLETDWKTEILAGLTTFMTMAYIVFVNPSILREAGMPIAAVTAATCLSAAFGSIMMGVVARYPIALAPGMGLNAYFTYSVVKGMGIPWQTALGAVFLSGVCFLVLTLIGVRQLIVSAIPHELYSAVAAGVGLFIAFIGFRNSGIVVPHPATVLAMGNLRDPNTAAGHFRPALMAALLAWGVRAAILIGILARRWRAFCSAWCIGSPRVTASPISRPRPFSSTSVQRRGSDFSKSFSYFLFVDLFDNVGTLVAVGQKAGLFNALIRSRA